MNIPEIKNRRRLLSNAAGFIVLLAYLNFAIGVVDMPNKLAIILAFAIGPVAIIGVSSITHWMADSVDALGLFISRVFLIIAFALFNLMLVVQQMLFFRYPDIKAMAVNESQEIIPKMIFNGVSTVQLGIDISFDIFYTIGLIALAMLMYNHSDFGKPVAILGILSALGLLVLNLWTFPYIPANSGLIDLGPITGIWWILVIIKFAKAKKKSRKE